MCHSFPFLPYLAHPAASHNAPLSHSLSNMIFSRTAARATHRLPRASQQVRGLHVDNSVNNVRGSIFTPYSLSSIHILQNFPFKYNKKSTFVAKSGLFMGFSFAIPFAACQYKKCVYQIWLRVAMLNRFVSGASNERLELCLLQIALDHNWRSCFTAI